MQTDDSRVYDYQQFRSSLQYNSARAVPSALTPTINNYFREKTDLPDLTHVGVPCTFDPRGSL